MFYTCCDGQLLNLCVFEKLGFYFFKNLGFFIKLEFLGQFFQNYEKIEHFNALVHASLMSMQHASYRF